MDIIKIKAELLKYLITNFDLNNPNLLRKYEHIQCVATYCSKIAKELNLTDQDIDLAYVLGLFHDYGRFTQWKRYQTYNDRLSCSHAELGANLLFKKNEMNNFSVPKQYYKPLKIAIIEHSKFDIDKSITEPKTLLLCKIIRDADKINLYELNINGELPTFTNADGVTKEVMDAVEQGECVNTKFVKTKLDRALLSLASTYDLNYNFSYKKLNEMNYFEKMKVRYEKILNEKDKTILYEAVDTVKDNLSKRNKT
ncbi:MAG: HD domain-containing protein [Clostridia bacterium]|nr:HD domain-containing protein [Clostridia bacterium]